MQRNLRIRSSMLNKMRDFLCDKNGKLSFCVMLSYQHQTIRCKFLLPLSYTVNILKYFNIAGFVDVETPTLFRKTPGVRTNLPVILTFYKSKSSFFIFITRMSAVQSIWVFIRALISSLSVYLYHHHSTMPSLCHFSSGCSRVPRLHPHPWSVLHTSSESTAVQTVTDGRGH